MGWMILGGCVLVAAVFWISSEIMCRRCRIDGQHEDY